MSEPRRFRFSPWASGAMAAAAGVSLLGVLLTPSSLAAWMAHPTRLGPNGAIPATTIAGAEWLRLALIVLPWIWLALGAATAALARPATTSETRPPMQRPEVVGLIGIVALGVMLRAPLLGQSLWYDEIVAFAGYSLQGPGAVVGNYYSQANHILSQLLIWASTALLGADEFTLRVPALLASILAIVFVWGAAREVTHERTALFAAFAMAVMPLQVLAGTDARGYAIAIGLVALALWGAARGRRCGSASAWTLFSIAIACAVWAHLVTVCFALGLGAAWAFDALRSRDRRASAGLVALLNAAVVTLLLYAPVLPDLAARRAQFGAHSAGVPSLVGPETWHALLGLGGAWVWWAAAPGLLLVCLGLTNLRRSPEFARLAIAGLLGLPIAFALAAAANSWLYARFLLFTLPAIAMLIALGCERLSRIRQPAGGVAIAFLGAIAAASILTLPPRQPLREALSLASAEAGPKRPVGVIGLVDNPLAYYGLVQGVELVDYGDRGSRLEEGLSGPRAGSAPSAIVVLYPTTLPQAVRESLGRHDYVAKATLPGWIDWGAGAVEIWSKRAGSPGV
ncbi:MAG: glycosyltransferase family 39 protein [Phycisphaerae bacterium]|nr:glycosyltransferase family 39 protein [Phycisphaerae bacterium]